MDNQIGIPYLYDIAEKHKNDDMRADAIFWIGDNAEDIKSIQKLSDYAYFSLLPSRVALAGMDNKKSVPREDISFSVDLGLYG